MATNVVDIVGDSSALRIEATNLSGSDPLEFTSGTFRSCPEERRIALVFFIVAGQAPFSLRFEFTSPFFVEHNILGEPIYNELGAL